MKNFIPLYNLLITLKLNHMRSNQFLKWIKKIDSSYKIRPDCWIKRREGLSNSIWGHGSRAVDKTNKQKKKTDKYEDLTWEMQKLWNMNITVNSFRSKIPETIRKDIPSTLQQLQILERCSRPQGDWG